MIPPCDPTILETNPHFKRLYQHLTTTLLNPDGSTRANDAQPTRKAVQEELRDCQLRNAKKQIKTQTLRQMAFNPDSELPDDCREPIAVVSLFLESSPSQLDQNDQCNGGGDVHTFIAPDIDKFYSNLHMMMPSFAKVLSSTMRDLRMLTNPGDTAGSSTSASIEDSRPHIRTRSRSKLAPSIPLSSQISGRLRALREMQFSELPASRTQMAATAAEVLALRTEVLERTVTLLERAKHGALARATKAKAEHLATVAHGVEGKLNVMRLDILAAIHTPEVSAALNRYHQHLRDTRERLEERREAALEELKAYEDADSATNSGIRGPAKSGPIGEIARRYGTLIREIEDVKTEIHRLGG
ncbi:hypothetical protein ARAM_000963 [Aspergillus rambellii]|uniref:Uncharacterized protein n=3 Tax=Aspergillus subgen. Nidulantes TaxID=2720870 RepID=A0A0F8VSI0_9EURO|nr:hypothetical protein AOCH_001713 [Aspergillus ochraceoroseus]KKK26166.1 hypothetical protein ARAM_000963 [Aspergillus rambellii]